ncbi:MAG: putative DNA-binding domain-containing protein [Steroidobacteraceae bacterium]
MLPLRELQKRFESALFDDAPDAVAPWIRGCERDTPEGTALDGPARLSIYRNNLREGFRKALALEFPVIERLVGADYFRQLALSFQAEHPSRAGDLHSIGEPFAQFLHLRFENTQYAYLPDVATLEWSYQESLVAVDVPPFDLTTLRDIPQHAYGQLRFTLHPACKLVRSAYPVVRIWAVNQSEVTDAEVVDLSSGADFVLLRRVAEGVDIRRVAAADFAILHAFSQGAILATALETAYALDPDFDLGEALRRFIGLGVFSRTQPTHSPLPGELSS